MLTQNILIVSNDPATLGLPRIENLKEKILKWSRKNPEAETIKVEANE
jgi:sugar phosphate permease